MNIFKKRQICLLICAAGLWLLAAPMTFGYRSTPMIASDQITGALLILAGLLSLFFSQRIVFGVSMAVGLWLELAPLLFWAPQSISFLNDTLIGFLVLSLAFLLPNMQGLSVKEGSDHPPGWSFNPSDWAPRIGTIFLAMVCWFLARYLSAYQLGYIQTIWDPFFGDASTIKVVTSKVASFFPVSDAGLGAFGYSMEAFMGWQGNTQRWRTMPWMVVFFGILVVPAGMISILLIILQPIAVGAWCGLCLLIAACMLTMIILTVSEVVAVAQLLYRTYKEGKSLWTVFWKGADASAGSSQGASKKIGISFAWNLLLNAILGIWIMSSPAFYHMIGSSLADSNYVAGPLIITLSLISMAEVIRCLRYFNIILGAFLICSPWILGGVGTHLAMNNLILGFIVIGLSFRKGNIIGRYGSWNRFIV